MKVEHTGRGFEVIRLPFCNDEGKEELGVVVQQASLSDVDVVKNEKKTTRVVQQSSACLDYDSDPGSTFLWLGPDHHLNHNEVKKLVGYLENWLDTGYFSESGWTTEAPTEPGKYWFYGDPWFGSTNGDYIDNKVEAYLYEVKIIQLGDGSLIAATSNTDVKLKPFDFEKQREGYCGYWKKINLPNPPEWKLSVSFRNREDEYSELPEAQDED